MGYMEYRGFRVGVQGVVRAVSHVVEAG